MAQIPLSQLLGQPEVSRFLRGIVARGRYGNAYLFHGPAGVGKGTAALPFDYIISYGAVDIDRKYATVWLMLGRDAERLLPPWTGFRNGSAQPEQSTSDGYKPVPLDDATLKAIDAMRGVVDAEVRKAGWTGTLPWVGFESTARVDRAGGPYRYFK